MEGYLLEERIAEIVDWFKGCYESPDGFPYFAIDSASNAPVGNRSLIAELGDYLPFLYESGATQYVEQQIELFRRAFQTRNPLFTRPVTRLEKGLRLAFPGGFAPSYTDALDYTEILYGLLACADLAQNREYGLLAQSVFDQVIRLFWRRPFIRSWRLPRFHWDFPLTEPLSGMFIEISLDLYAFFHRQERYLEFAQTIARAWLQSSFFKQCGIFPSALTTVAWLKTVPKIRRATRRAELCKANTSMAWGLLALWRATHDQEWMKALMAWRQGLTACFGAPEGGFYQLGNCDEREVVHPRAVLSTNFAVLEFFCDLSIECDSPIMLQSAVQLAEFWLKQQSPQTGLFPDEVNTTISYLDGNTDFVIAFLKLYELTGEDHYYQAALKAMNGILRYHRSSKGYVREVDTVSGQVVNPLIETRFVSLLLKVLLTFAHGWRILGDDGKDHLLRDR